MKRLAVLLFALAAVPAGAQQKITVDDVIVMAESGVSGEILIETVRASGQTFTLTDADIARLKKAGVSEETIRALNAPAAGATREQAEEAAREERARAEAAAAQASEDAAAERERRKAEAEKLAAGTTALHKQANAEIDRLIDSAYDDLGEQRYARAAAAFDKVVAGGLVAKNTVRFVDASYGLALALTRAGLPSAAAPHLVEVLRHGPTAPRYGEAIDLLARYAATVDYTHPILELLDGHDPKEQVDAHAFLVGAYRARFGDWDRARVRLAQVDANGARGPAAAYRLGLVEVAAGRPLEGLRAFEQAVERAEKRKDIEIRDLAYLALARIAYEVGRYDAAADYYKRIGVESAVRGRARYELVWTLLLAGDGAGALAAIEVVEAPRYAGEMVAPDLGVIEATVYLDLCRYDDAYARAEAYLVDSAPLLAWLEAVVDREPAAAYAAALERSDVVDGNEVGRRAVLSDVDTHVAASAAAAVAAELAKLNDLAADLGEAAGKRARATLEERRDALAAQAAAAALRRLRALRGEVAEATIHADEVKIEASFAKRELLHGTAAPAGGRGGRTRQLGGDESYWEIDDERWLDEEDDVTSFLPSQCPQVVE